MLLIFDLAVWWRGIADVRKYPTQSQAEDPWPCFGSILNSGKLPAVTAAAKRILVVEDDEDLRTLFRIALTLEGFVVDEARTGLDALRLFEHQPDLVVLDLSLPGIDGFAVLEEISAQRPRQTPIVIVTSSPRDLSRLEVSCVLRKPVAPDEFVATVRRCLASGSGAEGA